MAGIDNRVRHLRAKTFPPSEETSSYRHQALIERFDQLEQAFANAASATSALAQNTASLSSALTKKIESLTAEIERLSEENKRNLTQFNDKLDALAKRNADVEFLLAMDPAQFHNLIGAVPRSKAQLRQDIFVLAELGQKRHGYFVEFGATNGVDLSNTWLLEKEYGWTGILSEPAVVWQNALRENRSCIVDTRCVWTSSDRVADFSQTEVPELSTLQQYEASDMHRDHRKNATHYGVQTVTLLDLLETNGAPRDIDYLSIDTEGSEFEILNGFDFDRFHFSVITCEHNYTPMRQKIHDLLTSKGYRRKFEHLSCWDDWYVKS
jgi:FkbM family methyltransferase